MGCCRNCGCCRMTFQHNCLNKRLMLAFLPPSKNFFSLNPPLKIMIPLILINIVIHFIHVIFMIKLTFLCNFSSNTIWIQTNPDVINEIVICMDPSNPSSSILLAQSILSSIHPILISSFTHSSARCLDKVNSRINSSPSAHDRNLFKFGIAYIWKKGFITLQNKQLNYLL